MSTAELPVTTESAPEQATCPFCGAVAREGQTFCASCGQPGTPHAEGVLLHGTYRIAALLSTSSTGAVYRAQEKRRKRDVVLKELLAPAGSSEAVRTALAARFAHEVKVLDHLRHPCLPEVIGSFSENGRHYLVTNLLPGQDLQAMLAQQSRGFSERLVRDWLRHLVSLLEYLEERHPPFTHGEILPSHLMLRADGVPCLIGYALAPRLGLRPYLELPGQKILALEHAPAKRRKASKSGTLPDLSTRDDIYGLGASLHSLLTGRDVFAGSDSPASPFPPVRELAPQVNAGIAELINRAVAVDVARRYPSVLAMHSTLTPLLEIAPRAMLRPTAAAAPSNAGRRSGAWIAAVLVVGLAAVVAYLLFHKSPATSTAVAPTPTPASGAAATLAPPPPAHTLPIADAFIRPSNVWPNTKVIFRQGADLWIDNTAGAARVKAARISYSTGADGFVLRATLRQVRGPADAAYGIIAADKPSTPWENIAVLIRGTGQWSVVHNHGGHPITLLGWRQALPLRLGHNSANELQLALAPGAGKQPGTFVVTINGQRMSAVIPAWSTAPAGRVGITAAPGSEIVSDGLSVDPLSAKAPALEDHFLDNRLNWIGSHAGKTAPLLTNSELQLLPGVGKTWAEAWAPTYKTLPAATTFDEESVIGLKSVGGGPAAGGLVFARTVPPKAKPHRPKPPATIVMAAVLDTAGRVSVVQLSGNKATAVLGPIPSPRVRTGYGLNLLRVHFKRQGELIQIGITVNGGQPISFATGLRGLVPASGFAVTGADTIVTASVFSVFIAEGQMLHTRIHGGDGQRLVDPPHDEIVRLRQDPHTAIWIDLETPTPEELDFVASTFALMDLTVEDFLHRGQRAKLEGFDGYNVLIMHGMSFNVEDLSVETPELDIVLGKNFLITSHEGKMPEILKDPQGPEHACGQLGKSSTLALYGVVDRLVDSYYPVLESIDEAIDTLEARILTNPTPIVLQQIFALKHSLGFLRKVVSPQLEVFNRLISREDEFIDTKYVVYFRDIYDHLARTFEVIDSYRDLMSNAMDAYLSMVSNRQNEVMKRLTVFATIFLPITFVTGLFGQNFGMMPQVVHDNGHFWWFALGGMALLSAGQIVYYKRSGWI